VIRDGKRFWNKEIASVHWLCQNLHCSRAEAQRFLPEMAREVLPDGNHRSFVVSGRDEAGTVRIRMSLSLVVEDGDIDH
jgi:hypothetical protein